MNSLNFAFNIKITYLLNNGKTCFFDNMYELYFLTDNTENTVWEPLM